MKFYTPEEINKHLKSKAYEGFHGSLKIGRYQVACNSIEELMAKMKLGFNKRNILWRCTMCNKFFSDINYKSKEYGICPHCKRSFYD
jgi:rubrerythrin